MKIEEVIVAGCFGVLVGWSTALMMYHGVADKPENTSHVQKYDKLDLWSIAKQASDAKKDCEKSLPRDKYCSVTFTATPEEDSK